MEKPESFKAALNRFRDEISPEDSISAIGFLDGRVRLELFVQPKATEGEIAKHASALARLAGALGSPSAPVAKYWNQNNFIHFLTGRVDLVGVEPDAMQAVEDFRKERGYKEVTFWD